MLSSNVVVEMTLDAPKTNLATNLTTQLLKANSAPKMKRTTKLTEK